jgi:hypothetical protein
MEWRVGWFGWWSDVAGPQPVESKRGVALHPFEEAEVLYFLLSGNVWSANVAVLVVAIGEAIALCKPPCAHITLVIPLGPVLCILAC